MTAFWIAFALAIGLLLGWVSAHTTVARECEKLGGFYVGTKVYRCVLAEGDGLGQKAEGEKT